jgi:hypothetical protein
MGRTSVLHLLSLSGERTKAANDKEKLSVRNRNGWTKTR